MKKVYFLILAMSMFLTGCVGDASISSLISNNSTGTSTDTSTNNEYKNVTVKSVKYDETKNKKSIFRGDTASNVMGNISFVIDINGTEKTVAASEIKDFNASKITVDTSEAKADATISFTYNGKTYDSLKVDICTPADKFTINNGEVTSFLDDSVANPVVDSKYTKPAVIPRYVDGVEITKIGRNWAGDDTRGKITLLELPESLVIIGDSAFAWGVPITNLVLPNSIKTVENSAFAGSSIKTLTMPNSIETIGTNAFQYLGITITIINNSGNNDNLKNLITTSTPTDATITYVE